jgi:hypothetical protein
MRNEPRSGIGRQLGLDTQPPTVDDDLPMHVSFHKFGANLAYVGLCLAAVLMLYILGSYLDQEAEQRQHTERQQAWANVADQIRTSANNERVRQAYEQGQRDAMSALKGHAQGVALMQACMALQNTLENRFERGEQGAMATAPSASATNRAGG